MPQLSEAKILIMATDGFEQSELDTPLQRLREEGAQVHVATPDGEAITGWKGKGWGDRVNADCKITDVKVDDYIALVLPGGVINPDILRTKPEAIEKVRDFVENNKIVAAICHGPWLLIEAGVISGRKATSYHSIKTDMRNAGADWRDEEVVVDNGIVTSRSPDDLDAFVDKIIEEVREGEHERSAA